MAIANMSKVFALILSLVTIGLTSNMKTGTDTVPLYLVSSDARVIYIAHPEGFSVFINHRLPQFRASGLATGLWVNRNVLKDSRTPRSLNKQDRLQVYLCWQHGYFIELDFYNTTTFELMVMKVGLEHPFIIMLIYRPPNWIFLWTQWITNLSLCCVPK